FLFVYRGRLDLYFRAWGRDRLLDYCPIVARLFGAG
ncbi:hypothetical protein A2U01_0115851, partial [Trifolium medium]|nr:hypothetical protein [Trifolium medium]